MLQRGDSRGLAQVDDIHPLQISEIVHSSELIEQRGSILKVETVTQPMLKPSHPSIL